MGHSGFAVGLGAARECFAGEGQGKKTEAEERESRGFGDRGWRVERCVFADREGVVNLEGRRAEADGGEGPVELEDAVAFSAADGLAGDGEAGAAELA